MAIAAVSYWLGGRGDATLPGVPESECADTAAPLAECREELEQCRQQAANLAKGAEIDAAALAQARSEAGETRSRIERIEQDVALYKSLVDGSVRTVGVSAHSLDIIGIPGGSAENFRYRLTLIQRADRHAALQGFVTMTVSGSRQGKALRIPLTQAGDRSDGRLKLDFMYFQTLEGEFSLPAEFQPSNVRVQIDIRKGKPQKTERTFEWRVTEE